MGFVDVGWGCYVVLFVLFVCLCCVLDGLFVVWYYNSCVLMMWLERCTINYLCYCDCCFV